ncbi:MAG: dihydroorotase [Myxococcales bacterium]|nr:dihydroorotase [Myxococcales bacterium]MCB9554266.1 dihydroorotase [Myxococcales bacterium]
MSDLLTTDRLLITGGRVICPITGRDTLATVEIEHGHITAIHPGTPAPGPGGRVYDATGCVVAPGFVDLHCHLGEPGSEHAEDLATAGRAAAAGGFTALCARPDTTPPNDTRATTEHLVRRAAAVSPVRVWPIAALTHRREGRRLTEMHDLRDAGAVAFGEGDKSLADAGLMRRALEYARATGAPVFEYPEDARLAGKGVMHEGPVATRLGLAGLPAAAEDIVALRAYALARETRAPLHLGPISTRGALEAVRLAKSAGLPVTCAVMAAHLHLTDADVATAWNPDLNVRPPLRPAADRDALRAALADGTIDAITSGHHPQGPADKDEPFALARPGMAALETTLGLVLRLVADETITLTRALELLAPGPHRVLRRDGGQLVPGAPADLVVFDPLARTRIDHDTLAGRAWNTPYLGQALPGRVRLTLVAGRVAHAAPQTGLHR